MMIIKKLIYKNKVSKETFWALIAKAIAVLGGIFIVIFVPKFSGFENYGALTLILAYISFCGVFFGAPIQSAVKKEIAKSKFKKQSRYFFIEALRLKIIFSVIFTIILLIVLLFIDIKILKENLLLFIVLLVIMNLWGLVEITFESTHRLFFSAVMYLIEYSLNIIAILFFYYFFTLNITNLLWAFIIGYFFAFLFGLIVLMKKFEWKQPGNLLKFNIRIDKIILKRTFFLSLTGLLLIIMLKADTIVISFFLSLENVGLYNVASDITKKLAILSVPFILGVIPIFVKKNTGYLFKKYMRILVLLNLVIALGILLFANTFVRIVYGQEHLIIASIMRILSIYPLLATLQTFMQEILILKDKMVFIFLSGGIAAFVNIILNLLMIRMWGLIGAAIATTSSYFIWVLINFGYIKKISR
jgi:O-antigen/teichoic acid export membrane protein